MSEIITAYNPIAWAIAFFIFTATVALAIWAYTCRVSAIKEMREVFRGAAEDALNMNKFEHLLAREIAVKLLEPGPMDAQVAECVERILHARSSGNSGGQA